MVIGDTPADIECARVNGCRAVAVGTGPVHSVEDLRPYDPDLLLANLEDPEALLAWLKNLRA